MHIMSAKSVKKTEKKSDDDDYGDEETEGKVSNKKMRYVFDLYIIHCSY